MNYPEIPEPIDFEWDQNNEPKIIKKHGINKVEAEQVFFNFHLAKPDDKHSNRESRHTLIGVTNFNRVLFISFTVRSNKIRIISARAADRQERRIYEEAQKNS